MNIVAGNGAKLVDFREEHIEFWIQHLESRHQMVILIIDQVEHVYCSTQYNTTSLLHLVQF